MQKLTPFLWFDNNAEEAVNFYVSLFENSKINRVTRYSETVAEKAGRTSGSVMTMGFELSGYKFAAINGGPHFKLNPSISFFLNFDPSKDKNARENLDVIWGKLSQQGTTLMPLDKYPFSERYGWVQDKYGISWQLILTNPEGDDRPFIVPSFLFVGDVCGKAEEASDFYISLFKNSKRGLIARYPEGMPAENQGGEPDKEGTIMYTDFKLNNQWFAAMDSAREHNFSFNEAISFVISCEDQEEVDYFWNKFTEEGQESMCGWLKDKYGVSWQIVPTQLFKLLDSENSDKAKRVSEALMKMKKLDITDLEKAYNGK